MDRLSGLPERLDDIAKHFVGMEDTYENESTTCGDDCHLASKVVKRYLASRFVDWILYREARRREADYRHEPWTDAMEAAARKNFDAVEDARLHDNP